MLRSHVRPSYWYRGTAGISIADVANIRWRSGFPH
jgi:hypothetical protein